MLLQTAAAAAEKTTEAVGKLDALPTTAEETQDYLKNLPTLLQNFAVTYGGRLLIALLLLIVGFKLIGVLMKKLSRGKAMNKLDVSARGFAAGILGISLKILLCVTAALGKVVYARLPPSYLRQIFLFFWFILHRVNNVVKTTFVLYLLLCG